MTTPEIETVRIVAPEGSRDRHPVYRYPRIPPEEQERAHQRELDKGRDVLARLKDYRDGYPFNTRRIDIKQLLADAIDEIEWLRAGRPENSVTRQELNDITAPLREAQATISALLFQLENK